MNGISTKVAICINTIVTICRPNLQLSVTCRIQDYLMGVSPHVLHYVSSLPALEHGTRIRGRYYNSTPPQSITADTSRVSAQWGKPKQVITNWTPRRWSRAMSAVFLGGKSINNQRTCIQQSKCRDQVGYFDFHLYCTVYEVCHRQNTLWP